MTDSNTPTRADLDAIDNEIGELRNQVRLLERRKEEMVCAMLGIELGVTIVRYTGSGRAQRGRVIGVRDWKHSASWIDVKLIKKDGTEGRIAHFYSSWEIDHG